MGKILNEKREMRSEHQNYAYETGLCCLEQTQECKTLIRQDSARSRGVTLSLMHGGINQLKHNKAIEFD